MNNPNSNAEQARVCQLARALEVDATLTKWREEALSQHPNVYPVAPLLGIDGNAAHLPMAMRSVKYTPNSEVKPDGREDRQSD